MYVYRLTFESDTDVLRHTKLLIFTGTLLDADTLSHIHLECRSIEHASFSVLGLSVPVSLILLIGRHWRSDLMGLPSFRTSLKSVVRNKVVFSFTGGIFLPLAIYTFSSSVPEIGLGLTFILFATGHLVGSFLIDFYGIGWTTSKRPRLLSTTVLSSIMILGVILYSMDIIASPYECVPHLAPTDLTHLMPSRAQDGLETLTTPQPSRESLIISLSPRDPSTLYLPSNSNSFHIGPFGQTPVFTFSLLPTLPPFTLPPITAGGDIPSDLTTPAIAPPSPLTPIGTLISDFVKSILNFLKLALHSVLDWIRSIFHLTSQQARSMLQQTQATVKFLPVLVASNVTMDRLHFLKGLFFAVVSGVSLPMSHSATTEFAALTSSMSRSLLLTLSVASILSSIPCLLLPLPTSSPSLALTIPAAASLVLALRLAAKTASHSATCLAVLSLALFLWLSEGINLLGGFVNVLPPRAGTYGIETFAGLILVAGVALVVAMHNGGPRRLRCLRGPLLPLASVPSRKATDLMCDVCIRNDADDLPIPEDDEDPVEADSWWVS